VLEYLMARAFLPEAGHFSCCTVVGPAVFQVDRCLINWSNSIDLTNL